MKKATHLIIVSKNCDGHDHPADIKIDLQILL